MEMEVDHGCASGFGFCSVLEPNVPLGREASSDHRDSQAITGIRDRGTATLPRDVLAECLDWPRPSPYPELGASLEPER